MYEWVDHTSEVELAISASTETEVFIEAMNALLELHGPAKLGEAETATEALALEAPDRPALLAAWLEELVFLAESRRFVATRVERIEVDERSLGATIEGRLAEVAPLVKAVTYHRLSFGRSGEGWRATVILDV